MEEIIKQILIDQGIRELSDDIFVNIDGYLKNKSGNYTPRTFEAKIRGWHGIDKNEPIYAIFYNTISTEETFFVAARTYHFSACIRGGGISFVGIVETDGWSKEENAAWEFSWDMIESISFRNHVIPNDEKENPNAFFIENDPSFRVYDWCDSHILHFAENNSYIYIPCLYFGNYIITDTLESLIAGYQNYLEQDNNYYEWLWNEIDRLWNNNEFQTLINLVEEAKNNIRYDYYYYYIVGALIRLERYDEAKKYYDSFRLVFEKEDSNNESFADIRYRFLLTESELLVPYQRFYEIAENSDLIKQYIESDFPTDSENIQYYTKDRDYWYNEYITNFLQENYNNRKIITIAKTDSLFKSDHITLLHMNNLPAVNFPITHPKQDHTYICHPYKTDSYLPIENYDYELLNDRINEFCYLLQCLGATSISIENVKGESNDANIHSDNQFNAEASIRVSSGKVNMENEHKGRDYSKSMLKIGREQQFNPIRPPYVPEGLVWFPHEAGWHRLVQQRLEGSLLNHSEYMSSSEHKILSNSEMSDIRGELKLLFTSIKGGIKQDNSSNIETNQEVEWRINVTFKPMEQFGNESRIIEVNPIQELTEHKEPFTSKEIQYINEVKFMLEDDATIDEQEQRMLDEIQKTLEISAERAQELEKEAINSVFSFSSNEQKYIEEIKFMLEDDGMIDEQERKILDNMLDVLNISPERGQQLEVIVLNRRDLTKEEKEYLVKVKSFISDGVISDRERRMLNRLANLLGISEQRAIELEKQV